MWGNRKIYKKSRDTLGFTFLLSSSINPYRRVEIQALISQTHDLINISTSFTMQFSISLLTTLSLLLTATPIIAIPTKVSAPITPIADKVGELRPRQTGVCTYQYCNNTAIVCSFLPSSSFLLGLSSFGRLILSVWYGCHEGEKANRKGERRILVRTIES